MKGKIKLGCPNQDCRNHQRNVKFKRTVKECPECGSALAHVCKKCITLMDNDDEAYCVLCKAEREDRRDALGKGLAGAGAFACAAVIAIAKSMPEIPSKK